MIQRMSHTSVYCLDQKRAHEFYTQVLGMETRTDAPMGPGFRWVTVGPKGQPDLEITLMEVKAGMMMNEETATALRTLIEKGTFGIGVLETADVHATVAELKKKGAHVMQDPADRPYGIEALVRDDSGNWFSLCQRK